MEFGDLGFRLEARRTALGACSTDPDGDIVSWSIDLGDGTTPASGTWATDPPVEVTHDYGQLGCVCSVVLTVTDSAGHSSSDPMLVDGDNDPGFD
jgi:PKD domain